MTVFECTRQVVDLISLKPFDMETITNSVRKTRKVIIVEECMKTGGIGASLSAVINETLFDELDHQACVHPQSTDICTPLSASGTLPHHKMPALAALLTLGRGQRVTCLQGI